MSALEKAERCLSTRSGHALGEDIQGGYATPNNHSLHRSA
jgi:hypothetical protein